MRVSASVTIHSWNAAMNDLRSVSEAAPGAVSTEESEAESQAENTGSRSSVRGPSAVSIPRSFVVRASPSSSFSILAACAIMRTKGCSGVVGWKLEQRASRPMPLEPTRSQSSCSMRLLPIPASPESSTT